MINLALKLLLHDRLRAGIVVTGVGFAVTLVFVQLGLFLGLLGNASVAIENLRADLWVTSRNTANIDFSQPFSEQYVQRVRSVPGVARADNLIVEFADVALPSGAKESMLLYGMEDPGAWGLPWDHSGAPARELRRLPSMILDASARARFGGFEIGDYREVNGTRLKIIGESRGALSFTTSPIAFADIDLIRRLAARDLVGKTSYIVVRLEPGADAGAVAAEIARRLPYNDVHTSAAWAAQSRTYWVVSTGLGLNMITTIFLGALVGVVIVAQTLYTMTMEHAREFGTAKAIGASNRDIYRVVGQQSLIAAFAGFAAGVLITHAMAPLMAAIDLRLDIRAWHYAVVLAGTVAMCLTAAAVSFRRVSGLDPAAVFRG